MSLSMTEIEAITSDYFAAAGGRAVDIYFRNSFLLDLLMNRQAGLFERPAGGEKIRVPLNYSDAEGGFFTRSDTLSSDDRVTINAAAFHWKHAYGNATVYLTDEVAAGGDYAAVQFLTQKIETAQRTCSSWLASTLYSAAGDEAPTLTGLRALTSSDPDKAYGGLAQNDLVAGDGTTPWQGVTNDAAEAISLEVLQELRSAAKVSDGRDGKPNVAVTTESLYNKVSRILQVQQRFVTDDGVASAGFTHLVYEGMVLAADDYCPAGHCFAINTNYLGFAIHQNGFFARQPWVDLAGPAGRAMKILWHGNLICSNRKAHACHANLSEPRHTKRLQEEQMAQPMKLSFTQDVAETSPVKRETIGALRITADGRKFRYAKAGTTDLTAGSLGMAPPAVAAHQNLAATPAAIGDRVVSLTVGATAVAENAYEDGFLQVADASGQGRQYRILSNTACPASGTVILTLAEPIRGTLTVDSKVSLVPSPWAGVSASATEENLPAGVTPCDVPAGHYYFAQTGGVGCCLAGGTAEIGSMLVPGATAGSLTAMNATLDTDQPVAGVAFAAAFTTGLCQPCFLTLD